MALDEDDFLPAAFRKVQKIEKGLRSNGGTSYVCKPHAISFYGLGYWKKYLGHSSVNKKLCQSFAVRLAFS